MMTGQKHNQCTYPNQVFGQGNGLLFIFSLVTSNGRSKRGNPLSRGKYSSSDGFSNAIFEHKVSWNN